METRYSILEAIVEQLGAEFGSTIKRVMLGRIKAAILHVCVKGAYNAQHGARNNSAVPFGCPSVFSLRSERLQR